MADVPVSMDSDPVIELYKPDVDRTLLRENLKLTPKDLEAIAEVLPCHSQFTAGRRP